MSASSAGPRGDSSASGPLTGMGVVRKGTQPGDCPGLGVPGQEAESIPSAAEMEDPCTSHAGSAKSHPAGLCGLKGQQTGSAGSGAAHRAPQTGWGSFSAARKTFGKNLRNAGVPAIERMRGAKQLSGKTETLLPMDGTQGCDELRRAWPRGAALGQGRR